MEIDIISDSITGPTLDPGKLNNEVRVLAEQSQRKMECVTSTS